MRPTTLPPKRSSAATSNASRMPSRARCGSNLKKVFWPADGYTKGDLVAYYDAVAPLMLHYLRDRPAVLTRYPDGIGGKSFFQKDAPVYVPDCAPRPCTRRTPTATSASSSSTTPNPCATSRTWARSRSTCGARDRARAARLAGDRLRSERRAVRARVEMALVLRRLLEESMPGFQDLGATGLHVLVPLGRRYTHDESKTFARLLATSSRARSPNFHARTPAPRAGRQGVRGLGQNGHGVTIVAPYSLRPCPGRRRRPCGGAR